MRRCALCRGLNSPHSPAVFRAWRRCREQGKLHFPCDGLRRLPFCTLAVRERLAAASHSLPSSPNERNGGDTIAIYHCSIKIVSRGKGKSAVAAAAYRSGEKLTNEWDGLTHDYTKKGGVVHSEILLPAHAPPAFSDRSTLWNSVELSEKSNNAQLAREVEIALPVELSGEEQTRLVREYCSSQFVSKGMIADFNLHDTGGGNPHAHILLTMRPLDEKSAWLPKSKKEYVLDENGERIRLPSGRYKTRKVDLVDWNNRENAEVWRRAWADLANEYLEKRSRDIVGSTHTVKISRNDWVIVPGRHKAIVSEALFEKAQICMREYREREVMTGGGNPLKRKVICGVCGHAMQRDSRKNGSYRCVTKRLNTGFDCSEDRIPAADIQEAVIDTIQVYTQYAVSIDRLLQTRQAQRQLDCKQAQRQIQTLQSRESPA